MLTVITGDNSVLRVPEPYLIQRSGSALVVEANGNVWTIFEGPRSRAGDPAALAGEAVVIKLLFAVASLVEGQALPLSADGGTVDAATSTSIVVNIPWLLLEVLGVQVGDGR